MELTENHMGLRNNFYNQPDKYKDNQTFTNNRKIMKNKNFKQRQIKKNIDMLAFPIKN